MIMKISLRIPSPQYGRLHSGKLYRVHSLRVAATLVKIFIKKYRIQQEQFSLVPVYIDTVKKFNIDYHGQVWHYHQNPDGCHAATEKELDQIYIDLD